MDWDRTPRPAHAALAATPATLVVALVVALVGCADTGADSADSPGGASASANASASASASPTASPTASPSVPPSAGPPVTSPAATPPAEPGTAAATLETLPVKGRAPKTGYDRDRFGPAWADTDRNGCDTRNDILDRDMTQVVYKTGTHSCVVASGVLDEPYSGATVQFVRGQGTSDDVQIDHVVALSNSWQTGSAFWVDAKRLAFANDPLNLLAVDGRLNQQKGDGDAATWLPPDKSYRCDYVARQVAVKAKYGLWVTPAEHDAIARVLATCPGQPLPSD